MLNIKSVNSLAFNAFLESNTGLLSTLPGPGLIEKGVILSKFALDMFKHCCVNTNSNIPKYDNMIFYKYIHKCVCDLYEKNDISESLVKLLDESFTNSKWVNNYVDIPKCDLLAVTSITEAIHEDMVPNNLVSTLNLIHVIAINPDNPEDGVVMLEVPSSIEESDACMSNALQFIYCNWAVLRNRKCTEIKEELGSSGKFLYKPGFDDSVDSNYIMSCTDNRISKMITVIQGIQQPYTKKDTPNFRYNNGMDYTAPLDESKPFFQAFETIISILAEKCSAGYFGYRHHTFLNAHFTGNMANDAFFSLMVDIGMDGAIRETNDNGRLTSELAAFLNVAYLECFVITPVLLPTCISESLVFRVPCKDFKGIDINVDDFMLRDNSVMSCSTTIYDNSDPSSNIPTHLNAHNTSQRISCIVASPINESIIGVHSTSGFSYSVIPAMCDFFEYSHLNSAINSFESIMVNMIKSAAPPKASEYYSSCITAKSHEHLVDKMFNLLSIAGKNPITTLEKELEPINFRINELMMELATIKKRQSEISNIISVYQKSNGKNDTISAREVESGISMLCNNRDIKSVFIKSDTDKFDVKIYTNDIISSYSVGSRSFKYNIGRLMIEVHLKLNANDNKSRDLSNFMSIDIINLTHQDTKGVAAPHVQSSGRICLGSAIPSIVDAAIRYDIPYIVMQVLNVIRFPSSSDPTGYGTASKFPVYVEEAVTQTQDGVDQYVSTNALKAKALSDMLKQTLKKRSQCND